MKKFKDLTKEEKLKAFTKAMDDVLEGLATGLFEFDAASVSGRRANTLLTNILLNARNSGATIKGIKSNILLLLKKEVMGLAAIVAEHSTYHPADQFTAPEVNN